MQRPNWDRPFRCHIDASDSAVGGTPTKVDDDAYYRAVEYFSERVNEVEENYTANDHELLRLVYFLKRFRRYFEGAEFKFITDNQVLKNIFYRPDLSRGEARWHDFQSQSGITKLALEKGHVHVLGDALSRVPHASMRSEIEVNNLHSMYVQVPDIYKNTLERIRRTPQFGAHFMDRCRETRYNASGLIGF